MANLISNKKATINYEFLEKMEAGLELLGLEVKSLRKGQGNLEGSYVIIRGGEAYLTGMTIPPFQTNNTPKDYEPTRNRKLLLTKSEIKKLAENEAKKGLTIVPILVYNKGSKLKLELAIARGKREFDKRQDIKKRDTERDMMRTLKGE